MRRPSTAQRGTSKAGCPRDLNDVVAALLRQAKAGDVASIKELLQRLLGPPESMDLIERLDAPWKRKSASLQRARDNHGVLDSNDYTTGEICWSALARPASLPVLSRMRPVGVFG